MADSELEKAASSPNPLPEPSASDPDPNPDKGGLGTTSQSLSAHTLESVASSSSPSTVIADNEDAEHGGSALDRVVTPQKDAIEVPRSQRRGLLGRFTLVAEVQDPYDYSNNLKWFITFIVAFAAAAAPMGSSIFFRKSILTHQGQRVFIDPAHVSFAGTGRPRPQYLSNHYQPISSTIHAKHGDISSVVVSIF
jgi:hypothetical protein